MRKLLSILCCAILLLSVSSCTKQYITPNPNRTVYADLTSADWKAYTDAGGVPSYQAPIDVAALDGLSSDNGGVVVSISYDNGATYEQLPEVYGNVSYTYTYNKGNVTLYAQSANGAAGVQPTDAIKVKIILVASN